MDEDKLKTTIENAIQEYLENIGIDTSSVDARREAYLDFLFLRELRSKKSEITQSIWKLILDRISQAIFTALAILLGSLASMFMTNHK